MQKYFIFFLVFSGLFSIAQGLELPQAAWCKINKTSGNCEKAEGFKKLAEKGCVAANSTCRRSFCLNNCLKEKPQDKKLQVLCRAECNPDKKDESPAFGSLLSNDDKEIYTWLYMPSNTSKEQRALYAQAPFICSNYCDDQQLSPTCNLNKSACEDPQTFKKLLDSKCVKIISACRVSFCKTNCLGPKPPIDDPLQKMCRKECNPLLKYVGPVLDASLGENPTEVTQNRKRYYERFSNRDITREKDILTTRSYQDSQLPWCEGNCDYDQNNPSCERGPKSETWETCKQRCSFIPDMKAHIEGCLK